MLKKTMTIGAVGLAAFLAPAVMPFGGVADTRATAQALDRVWVSGHYEVRDSRQRIPAEVRQEWVPPRYEQFFVPDVTEQVRVPAVVRRVDHPPEVERTFVPAVTERYWQHGYWDLSGWNPAHFESRVVRPGHYEERVVRPGFSEDRVVREERMETRVVTPGHNESRIVERGHWTSVTVRPERFETVREKVWVPGHYEDR